MDTYFAKLPSQELAAELEAKITKWGENISRTGIRAKWMKAYRMYYGKHWKSDSQTKDSEIMQMGEDGELSALTVNDFRNLIKHMLVLTTNQKPSFDPRATNTDSDSLVQTRLAKNVLDYYVRDKRLRRHLKTAAEMALVFGKGFVKIVWDKSAGKPFGVQDVPGENGELTQKMIYEGDVKVTNLDPFAVFVDQNLESWSDVQWVITREWKNKWDLAARNPQLADKIMGLPTKKDMQGFGWMVGNGLDETDLVAEYEFYHIRCDALPNGRYVNFLSNDVVVYDDAIPYSKLPVLRCVAGDYFGSTEGYTEAFDIMNLQQAQNVLASTFYTNQSTFGVQNILVPEGANISAMQISKALQVIKYNPAAGEPKPLQLTSSPPELWKGLEYLGGKMETVFGMNSVARGNPSEDMSGKALGLLQSMAIQYASNFQESYAELTEDCGTVILHLIKDFAKTERVVSVGGKFNRGDMIKFSGQDLSQIDRVVVELGNQYSKSLAGRMDLADKLMTNGMLKSPEQYMQVLETGNLETVTEGPQSQISLIRQENEAMQEGKPAPVLVTDTHPQHILEHMVMLSRPDVRTSDPISQLVLQHVQQHIELGKTQDPYLAMIKGEPPPLPPPMPLPNEPGNGQPVPQPGPEQGMPVQPQMPEPAPPPGPDEALNQALR